MVMFLFYFISRRWPYIFSPVPILMGLNLFFGGKDTNQTRQINFSESYSSGSLEVKVILFNLGKEERTFYVIHLY